MKEIKVLYLTSNKKNIIKRALEHLKVEYETSESIEDKADLKIIKILLTKLV